MLLKIDPDAKSRYSLMGMTKKEFSTILGCVEYAKTNSLHGNAKRMCEKLDQLLTEAEKKLGL